MKPAECLDCCCAPSRDRTMSTDENHTAVHFNFSNGPARSKKIPRKLLFSSTGGGGAKGDRSRKVPKALLTYIYKGWNLQQDTTLVPVRKRKLKVFHSF